MKQDIRDHADCELSLICMNDETLYKMVTGRRATRESITELCDELFIYTPAQLVDLLDTVDEDRGEDQYA